jgi:hypothetical protein
LQLVASWSFWNPASNFSDTAASTILMRGRTRRGIYNLKKKMKIILTIRLVSHHQRPFEFHSSSQVYLKQKTLGGGVRKNGLRARNSNLPAGKFLNVNETQKKNSAMGR